MSERNIKLPVIEVVLDNIVFKHVGLLTSNNTIIHVTKKNDSPEIAEVLFTEFEKQNAGKKITLLEHKNSFYTLEQVESRARSQIGNTDYSVLGKNCEHFVNWCVYGMEISAQVDRAKRIGLSSLALIGGMALIWWKNQKAQEVMEKNKKSLEGLAKR